MNQSRLHDQHAALGAAFGETAGWTMPKHYGNPDAEYKTVRTGVGIADLSHRGRLRVTGDDRVKWLQGVISNDLLPLTPGQGLYSSFLNHKGRMLTYFRVYLLADWLLIEDVGEIGDTTLQSLKKFLLYGTKAKMENLAEPWGLLLVSGPKAADLIKTALGADAGGLKPIACLPREIAGRQGLILRTEETGETDFEILLPSDGLAAAWEHLLKAGASMGVTPFGTDTREVLRIEAGLPVAGHDITDEIVPHEANLEGKAFSLSKGCYPGQELVARMDTYGSVRRHLSGLILKDAVVPSKGAKLFSGDREVGWISSAVRSPSIGSVIAFGFPLRDFSKPGTALTVDINGQRHDATVHALPFYAKG
jgi:glycine cleavage system T protein